MADTLRYETTAGRVPTLGVALFGFGFLSLAVMAASPWYVLAIACAIVIALLWLLSALGRAGMKITADRLVVWQGNRQQSYPMADIDQVRVHRTDNGRDEVALWFTDGTSVVLPRRALPDSERFRLTLLSHGIPVRRMS